MRLHSRSACNAPECIGFITTEGELEQRLSIFEGGLAKLREAGVIG